VERPTDEALRKAQTTLRGLVSDGPSRLPSLNLIADSIRLELEKSGQVALLYVSLSRYGRLEPVFGWRIVGEILDAVAANLEGMVGSTLRRLDVVSDFTLTDDAFIVLLSPPRSTAVIADDDLAAITRRVYERLQSLLLNDLAPGVYDRVHPSVGAAVLAADPSETFEQNLQRGLALAMQAAGEQAALYDRDLEATLARLYEVCLAAQLAGLAAMGAGVTGGAADAGAREVIAAAGWGEHFGHGLGHGVGLEVHEAPAARPESTDTLEPGNVLSCEPGIYLPGVAGVRIEDLVLITDGGRERLTHVGKELVTVG